MPRLSLLLMPFLLFCFYSSTAEAKTWTVPSEVPDIVSAVDAASPGDLIKFESGEYSIPNVNIEKNLGFSSVSGDPSSVLFSLEWNASIVCWDCDVSFSSLSFDGSNGCIVSNTGSPASTGEIQFRDCVIFSGYGVAWIYGNNRTTSIILNSCTVAGMRNQVFGRYLCDADDYIEAQNTIFYNCDFWSGDIFAADSLSVGCVDIYPSPGPVYDEYWNGSFGNFSEDPRFCDPIYQDYFLRQDSPCIDAGGCGLIGAMAVGCDIPPEYEVLSVTPIRSGSYQNGVDVAQMDVVVRNNYGPGQPSFALNLFVPQAFSEQVVSMTANLPLGQSTTLNLSFLTPAPGFSVEYRSEFVINGQSYFSKGFTGSELSSVEQEQVEQETLECMPPGHACVTATMGMIPFAGNVADAAGIVGGACEVLAAQQEGDAVREGVALVSIGLSTFSIITDYIAPPAGNVASFVASAINSGIVCGYEAIVNWDGPAKAGVIPADSVAIDLLQVLDGIGEEYSNQLVVSGPGSVRIHQGGFFSDADTLGLKRTLVADVDSVQLTWAHVGIGPVPLGEDPAGNLPNAILAELRATASGLIDVALLHRTGSGLVSHVEYEPFAVTENSVCWLELEDETQDFGIRIDYEGDGIVDHIRYATGQVSGVDGDSLPDQVRVALFDAYPNPFNPITTIAFETVCGAHTRLAIYDVAGRIIRTLVDEVALASGRQVAVWDGRNSRGHMAAAGVYFYRLEADGYSEAKRMVLVK